MKDFNHFQRLFFLRKEGSLLVFDVINYLINLKQFTDIRLSENPTLI